MAEYQAIKRLREKLSLSQEEFSERAGFSVDLLRKIEGGRNKLTVDRAKEIADAFNVSLDYLYGRTEDKSDEASIMLLYLRKLFNFKVDEDYENPYFLEVSQPIISFLLDYKQAEDLFNSGKIPEAAFAPWVEKLKDDLNDALKNGTLECTDYCLVPKKSAPRKDSPKMRVSLGGPLGG